mgnify:CR=1 FL=1
MVRILSFADDHDLYGAFTRSRLIKVDKVNETTYEQLEASVQTVAENLK